MNNIPNLTITEMTATLQQQAQETITDNVLNYTQALCEALRQDFIQYSIRVHKRALEKGADAHYHIANIQDLRNGKCNYSFVIESGRKYHKIIMVIDNGPGRPVSRSCHAFVNKETGQVYKSASWKAPAKVERCNLLIIKEREWALEHADWAGYWLYKR